MLVAHSLACVLVTHWALRTDLPVRAALLVAPSNPDRPDFDRSAVGFSPVPRRRLPFPSILVASSNDPKGTLEYAAACAEAWGSRFVNVGAVGHINVASGLGDWPQGQLLYRQLEALAQPQYRGSRQANIAALSAAHN
jgi:predicted alpha/beta hydrolase family esterase